MREAGAPKGKAVERGGAKRDQEGRDVEDEGKKEAKTGERGAEKTPG